MRTPEGPGSQTSRPCGNFRLRSPRVRPGLEPDGEGDVESIEVCVCVEGTESTPPFREALLGLSLLEC